MEQMDGKKLTRRTDVYSWAVSVMEMYVGSRPWANGVVAGLGCHIYFEQTLIPMPGAMKELLAKCMESDESKRPHDFGLVEEKLLEIYKDETQTDYPRPASKAAEDTADSLNNRALSLLDLGKPEEAEKCWERALYINSDHGNSIYNRCVYNLLNSKINEGQATIEDFSRLPGAISLFYQAKLRLGLGHAEGAIAVINNSKIKPLPPEIIQLRESAQEMLNKTVAVQQMQIFRHDFGDISFSPGSVCISPDGEMALSVANGSSTVVDWNHRILLWDLHNGIITKEFISNHPTRMVCFSKSGKFALSCGDDRNVKIWEVDSGKCIHEFIHNKYVNVACFCFNDSVIISFCGDGSRNIWSVSTGQCLQTDMLGESYAFANGVVSFDCHGQSYLSLSFGGSSAIINLEKFEMANEYNYNELIGEVCFSSDGKFAIADGELRELRVRRRIFPDLKISIDPNNYSFHHSCIGPDNTSVLSNSRYGMVLYQLPPYRDVSFDYLLSGVHTTENLLAVENEAKTILDSLEEAKKAMDINGALLLLEDLKQLKSFDYRVYYREKEALSLYCKRERFTDNTREFIPFNRVYNNSSMHFSPNGNLLLVTDPYGKSFSLLSTENGNLIWEADTTEKEITDLNFNPAFSKIISVYKEGAAVLWDATNGERLFEFNDDTYVVTDAKFFDERYVNVSRGARGTFLGIAQQAEKRTAKLWDCITGRYVIDSLKDVSKLNGQIIFLKIESSRADVIDMTTNRTLLSVDTDNDFASLSPDGRYLYLWNLNHGYKVIFWDIVTGQIARQFEFNRYDKIRISPDDNTLFVTNSGSTAVYDISTGRRLHFPDASFAYAYEKYDDNSYKTFMSRDGKKYVRTDDKSCVLSLWAVETNKCIWENISRDSVYFSGFNHDSSLLKLRENYNGLLLMDAASGQPFGTVEGAGFSSSYCFQNNTQLLFSGKDGITKVYLDYDLTPY